MMLDPCVLGWLRDYGWETLSEALRDLAYTSRQCKSPQGGTIPTWPLLEAAKRLEDLEAEVARLNAELSA